MFCGAEPVVVVPILLPLRPVLKKQSSESEGRSRQTPGADEFAWWNAGTSLGRARRAFHAAPPRAPHFHHVSINTRSPSSGNRIARLPCTVDQIARGYYFALSHARSTAAFAVGSAVDLVKCCDHNDSRLAPGGCRVVRPIGADAVLPKPQRHAAGGWPLCAAGRTGCRALESADGALVRAMVKEVCQARFEAFGTAGNASRIRPLSLAAMSKRY